MPAKKKTDVAVATEVARHAIEGLQELDGHWKQFAVNMIRDGLRLGPPGHSNPVSGGGGGGSSGDGGGGSSDLGPPRAFLRAKQPQGPIQIVACLAHYLTAARNQPQFNSGDLRSLYGEAAYAERIRAWPVAVANAQKAKYLAAGTGRGVKQLSHLGEDVVNALPSQEKVLALKAAGRRQRGGRRRRKRARAA